MSSLSAQATAKREANPEAYGIHVPAHLDVRAIRTKLKMEWGAARIIETPG